MRLLLAEDERELSEALVVILKHSKYMVDAVYNGIDALDYAVVGDYDGIILDVMMPGMDGFLVVRKLREQGIQTPVLILTAKSEIDDKVMGLDSGADDYLTKPFAMKELLARVRAITRRRTEAVSSVIRLGNVELDCTLFVITNGEKCKHLTGKEFQMLQLFMSSPTQVFSAETILEKIWGYETDADINVVWVNISYLRKKLEQIGANIHIRAIRNRGYHIEVSDS